MPKPHPASLIPGPSPFKLSTLRTASSACSEKPETFRLPVKGGDPYFGLTRGWYYAAEKDGLIRLVRLRKRGRPRGVTLVPYDDIAAIVAAAKLG